MHYITQETHAIHYTRNTRTTLQWKERKHMHNITQETHALYYTGNTRTTLQRETHALHRTGNTCTTLHREHMQTTLRNRHIKVQIERKLS